MAKVQQVITLLNELAPQKIAYEWDNVGLQIGSFNQEVRNILLTLDYNSSILDEANKKNCNLVISHHPLIFKGMKSIHDQTETGRLIQETIRSNISLYTAHTNLDIVNGGLNDFLGQQLGLEQLQLLDIKNTLPYYKLVFFVPVDYMNSVREAVFEAGAGHIGNYSHTSFCTEGEGTFYPEEKAKPFLGNKGKLNNVNEFRVETIVSSSNKNKVVKALLKSHPYEEVAYDLYQIEQIKDKKGLGRIGQLKTPLTVKEFINIIKNTLSIPYIKFVTDDLNKKIEKIAICSGSGADLIGKAKYAGADLFVTGDVKYHEAQYAEEINLSLVDAGHYWTEYIVIDLLKEFLEKKSNENKFNLNIFASNKNTNPWKYI